VAAAGVGGDQRAGRARGFFEQRRERGDFVVLLGKRHLIQCQAQVMHHGGEQLQGLAIVPAAAAQHLALDGQAG
jgi:hypothetical protein